VRPKLSWRTCYKTIVNGILKGHPTLILKRLIPLNKYKPNLNNVPLQELVANNAEGVDVDATHLFFKVPLVGTPSAE
jgi:hypothetical protein